MEIEFDAEKNARNFVERQLSFDLVSQFELDTAVIKMDVRKNYKELRFNALGFIGSSDDRLYHLTFTIRSHILRVISLRKASRREVKEYARNH